MPHSISLPASNSVSSHSRLEVDSTTPINSKPSRFSIADPAKITKLVRAKDKKGLQDNGGTKGMLLALETNMENGVLGDRTDIDCRRKAFGSNFLPQYNLRKCYRHFAVEAMKDPMIVLFFICAVLSLCFGIQKHGLKQGWKEGLTKILAILVVVIVSSGGKFWPIRQCLKFSDRSGFIPEIDVVRSSKWQRISICRVVIGDIVFLKPGDQVPADGLFLDGCLLHTEVMKPDGQIHPVKVDAHENPFLFFGSTVVDGYARMLVTAVGKNAKHHTIYLSGSLIDELKRITSKVGKIGKSVALLTFFVLLGRFLTRKIYDGNRKTVSFGGETVTGDVFVAIIGILATPAMIALTSRPEELVLAVRMCLANSMKKLMRAKILVREPAICHSVASVSTVCVNKTGTLTIDTMEVTKFWQGLINSTGEVKQNVIAEDVLELLHQGIGLNTTQPPSRSSLSLPRNSTEKTIFEWAIKKLKMVQTLKKSFSVLEMEPFNSKKRQSAVLIRKNEDNAIHEHRKGAPEVIIPLCSHYYESNGSVEVMTESSKALFEKILDDMAENGLRCIAFAHRKTSSSDHRDSFTFSSQQLILLGLVGLTNSPRIGTRETVEECHRAGINVKLITGDNKLTARIMASKCGIIEPDYHPGEVVEGEEFRNFTSEERLEKVENIRVLAKATPDDKALMVRSLKQKGHVVAFLGRGIGDIQALQAANVALCFGTQGAEILKACCAIVIANKDFPLIISALRWGRGIHDSAQICIQFLLSSIFAALIVDFVMAVSSSDSPLSTGNIHFPVFQLLWMKLIAGTLAALALMIEKPSQHVMQRPPRHLKEPLMTAKLLCNIYAQVVYEIAIFLVIHFKGKQLFNVNAKEKDTLILCTYILCQAFSIFNARLSNKNIFKEMQTGKLFLCIIGLIVSIQIIVLEVLKGFSGTARLGFGRWGLCIAFAAAYSIVAWPIRCMSELGNSKHQGLKAKID